MISTKLSSLSRSMIASAARRWASSFRNLEVDGRRSNAQRFEQLQSALDGVQVVCFDERRVEPAAEPAAPMPPMPIRRRAPESQATTADLVSPWASMAVSKLTALSRFRNCQTAGGERSQPGGNTIRSSIAGWPSNRLRRVVRPPRPETRRENPRRSAAAIGIPWITSPIALSARGVYAEICRPWTSGEL